MLRFGRMLGVVIVAQLTQSCAFMEWALAQAAHSQKKCDPLPDPLDVLMASRGRSENLGMISLYQCVNTGDVIECSFSATKSTPGIGTYSLNEEFLTKAKLIDNSHENHSAVRAYFIVGKCNKKINIDLNQGDSIWFNVDFDGPDDQITKATVSLPKYAYGNNYYAGQNTFFGPVSGR